ncbi:MAG: sodium:solute symporter family protein [Verrucomicrobiota bacterium]
MLGPAVDLAILLAFVVYAVASGLRARRQAGKNLEEYFLAGRSLPGWKAGTSMAATQFAADTPLVVTGLIAVYGISSVWRFWVYGLAFLMMGFIFARMWRRAGVLTDAELTEIRYSGPGALWLRGAKAIYYGTVFNCVVLAMVLFAAVRICEVFLPWHQWLGPEALSPLVQLAAFGGFNLTMLPEGDPSVPLVTASNMLSLGLLLVFVALYSTTGGLRAVVNTDVGQFIFMMVGTALYAGFVWWAVGGIEGIQQLAIEKNREWILHDNLDFLPNRSFSSVFDPNLGIWGNVLFPFLTLIGLQWFFQINSDGTGYLAQRSMACRSDGDAKRAGVLFAWMQIFLRSILWLIIGVSLLVLSDLPIGGTHTGDLPPTHLSHEAYWEMKFVEGIDLYLPWGVRGIMLTAMLAALASTLDSHLNWGAGYWSNDLYKRIWCERLRDRRAGDRELVWVARLSNLLIIGIALAIMTQLGSIQQAWTISLIFGAGMGFVLVARWLWERINLWSELFAIVVSLAAAPVIFYNLEQDWLRMLAMAVASTTAAVAGTFLGRTDAETLKSFYLKVQPVGWWGQTARLCNQRDAAASRRRFWVQAGHTALAAVSLFGALFGVGKLLFHLPGESLAPAVIALFAAALAAPFWLRALWRD